ncbi:MAG TPA: DUF983 domain-containing protein [Longimicrobiales bacterium]
MQHEERRGNPTALPAAAEAPPLPAKGTLLGRGLLCRCPRCGERNVFESWFEARECCPRCGMRLDRGEHDFWIGAWMLNLVGVETVFALLLVALVVALWPDVPWTAITWTGVLGMVLLPLLLFPVSRTLWLAIDMAVQPERPGDFPSAEARPSA